ncbi:MAG: hypothetical protein BWY23_02172 [Spirochaetes bacterium ADurb.Bin218]|nr:MAG: hypothetical protein BWY23_02172 [Spirochaetes bacterium ADurb.Bin218]
MIKPKRLTTFKVTPETLRPMNATIKTMGIVAVTIEAILMPSITKRISARRIKPEIAFVITESIVSLVKSLVILKISMDAISG